MKVKLGELTKIKTGKLDANAASSNGEYPFFTCSIDPLRISSYSYDCECVLVAGNGDLNVKYYNGKFDAYQRTYIIEENGSNRLYMPYLYYFMEGYVEELRKLSIGGVIKYIKLGNLTDALIELPNVEKQKEIVGILRKAKSIVDARQRELATLDNIIKARFVEMFGDPIQNELNWTTKPLSKLGFCKNGMNFHYDNNGITIKCLGVGDFKNNTCIDNIDELQTISITEIPSNEYLLKDEDIVFVRSNGNKDLVGRSVVVYPKNIPITFSGFCIRFRKNTNVVTTQYLLTVLKTVSVRQKMIGRGANIQNLNQQILGNLEIPIPPIELQNDFADFVKQVDKSKFVVQQALEKTQLLFDSLMQKYFG